MDAAPPQRIPSVPDLPLEDPVVQASPVARLTLVPGDTALFWGTLTRPLRLVASFEFLFALFVFGGTFKANPTFERLFPIDPTLLFGAASLGVGLLIVLRDGLYRPAVVPILLYFAFCNWVAFSMFWTRAGMAPIVLHLVRIVLINSWVLIGTCGIVAGDRRRMSRFLAWIVLLALAAAVDWIAHAGSLSHIGFLGDRSYQSTARLIAAGFIVLFGILTFGRAPWLEWLATALGALLFFYALLITGARAPLIGLVLGATVMLAMTFRFPDHRILMRTGALPAIAMALGVVTFVVFLLQSGVETWTMRRLQSLMRFFSNMGSTGDDSAAARAEYVIAAIHYWTSSWPAVIFGNGILSFTYSYAGGYVPGTHPHDIPVEVLTEFGLVGLALFAAFAVSLLQHASFRVVSGESWTPVVIGLCIGALFFSVTSGDMVNLFYFLVFGGLLPGVGTRRPATG